MQEPAGSETKTRPWLLALVCMLAGAGLLAGGVQLARLGGSWYYLIAGAGLAVTGNTNAPAMALASRAAPLVLEDRAA